MLLDEKIKNKIKKLLDEKKIKTTKLSVDLGYSRGFINSIIGMENKSFNLIHIEKICEALDYPIELLFKEGEADEKDTIILNLLQGMEEEKKHEIIKYIKDKKLLEELLKERKKRA